jgi:hypothetical protein
MIVGARAVLDEESRARREGSRCGAGGMGRAARSDNYLLEIVSWRCCRLFVVVC